MKLEIDLKFNVGDKAYLVFCPYGANATVVEVAVMDMEVTCKSVAFKDMSKVTCFVRSPAIGRVKTNDYWLFKTEEEAKAEADILNEQISKHRARYIEIWNDWWLLKEDNK